MSGLDQVVLGFAEALRTHGLAVSPDRAALMVRAVGEVDLLEREQVRSATRATCCGSADDVRVHDAVFNAYFGRRTPPGPSPWTSEVERAGADGPPGPAAEPGTPLEAAHSAEALRTRPLTRLDADERAEARRLLASLDLRHPVRRARRGARGGARLDPRATTRALLRHGGEPVRLHRRRPRVRPRRVVALLDVSGSMKPWADAYLRFGHALGRAYGAEVFTLATRLTRVTGELARPHVDDAVAAASRAMPDWTGGTRLADGLTELATGWGRRGPLRGTVVVICSDGLERGEPDDLAAALATVARLAHRVVWVHPRAGADGWRPRTRGLAACLPLVDALVPGGTIEELEEVGEAIAGPPTTRRTHA